MLLAIDAGNSSVKVALYDEDKFLHQIRIRRSDNLSSAQYADFLQDSIEIQLGRKVKFSKAVVCSVVPSEAEKLSELVSKYFGLTPIMVGPKINTGINIRVTEPHNLGTDRLTNAAAAKALYKLPALVFDIGTALTADYTDADGNFMGGMIIPGPELAYKTMSNNTAQLPMLDIAAPINLIGRNTSQAMHSGIFYGWLSMIEGITAKVKAVHPELQSVIITGGYCEMFKEQLSDNYVIDKRLTLKGLKIIADLN